jgi:hypothetical protein
MDGAAALAALAGLALPSEHPQLYGSGDASARIAALLLEATA